MDNLTQAEVEALRELQVSPSWSICQRHIVAILSLISKGLVGESAPYNLTDKGRAVVERLGAE